MPESEAGLGDTGFDHPAVFGITASLNEMPALQPIQQARDVGVTMNHALSNFAASQAIRAGAAQDPQRVILGWR
jgi:hypothetical protein